MARRPHHFDAGSSARVPGNDRGDARERIAEIGELLALGLVRLLAPKSSPLSAATGDSFVDCLPTPSGHAGNQPETAV